MQAQTVQLIDVKLIDAHFDVCLGETRQYTASQQLSDTESPLDFAQLLGLSTLSQTRFLARFARRHRCRRQSHPPLYPLHQIPENGREKRVEILPNLDETPDETSL